MDKDEQTMEKRRKLLTTLDVDVTPDPGRPPEPSRMVKTGGSPDQDLDTIARYGTREEKAAWAGLINERLHKKRAENLYWRCDKCGAVEVSPGDADIEGRGCLRCNWMSWTTAGHVRRLRGADLKAYLKLTEESEKRALERMKEQQEKAAEAFRMKVAGGDIR